jgi:hypothetical protein
MVTEFTLGQLIHELNTRTDGEKYPEHFVAAMINGVGPLNRHLALYEMN